MRRRLLQALTALVPAGMVLVNACQSTTDAPKSDARLVLRSFPSSDAQSTGVDDWDLVSVASSDGDIVIARGYAYSGDNRAAVLEVIAKVDGAPSAHIRSARPGAITLSASRIRAMGRDLQTMSGSLPAPRSGVDAAKGDGLTTSSLRPLANDPPETCDPWAARPDASGGLVSEPSRLLCCGNATLVRAGAGLRQGARALTATDPNGAEVTCADGAAVDANVRCSSDAPRAANGTSSGVAPEGAEPCADPRPSWGLRVELRDNSDLFSDASAQYRDDWPCSMQSDGRCLPPDVNDPRNPGPPGWRKPEGGWYVAPIHATLLPEGKVLLTGWGRRWHDSCGFTRDSLQGRFDRYEGGRNHGTSLVLDPKDLTEALASRPPQIAPQPPSRPYNSLPDLSSAAELTLTTSGNSFIVDESPVSRYQDPANSQDRYTRDVLYCAGHAPMTDGKGVLFAGGARYIHLGRRPGQIANAEQGPAEIEDGLNYARVFDSESHTFRRSQGTMTGGPTTPLPGVETGARWYPTVTRLGDGRMLVGGGFWGYRPAQQGVNLFNPTIDIFDPASGRFTGTLGDIKEGAATDAQTSAFNPGDKDYAHIFLLPHPVKKGSVVYDLVSMGSNGRMVLVSTMSGLTSAQRFLSMSMRPGGAGAADATAALVSTTAGDRILVMGGTTNADVAASVDLYDPISDQWTSFDARVPRQNGAAVLLPDGRVLLTNGYDPGNAFGGNASGQPEPTRKAVVFNPNTQSSEVYPEWDKDRTDRGYHNFGLLLKDGKVLIGGGMESGAQGGPPRRWEGGVPGTIWKDTDIGCERSDVRILTPDYLTKGRQPVIPAAIRDGQTLSLGGAPLTVIYDGPALRPSDAGGIVLMALGSFTHGFDQNQRYVKVSYACGEPGAPGTTATPCTRGPDGKVTLSISPPPRWTDQFEGERHVGPPVVPPGGYMMYFVSDAGVPSVAKYVIVQ